MSKVYKKAKKQYLSTGVKKIVPVKTANITVKSGTFDNPYYVIVKGDTYMYVTVPEEGYYPKTPEFRKGKEKWIYRMLSKHNPNFTQNDAGAKTGRAIEFRIIKRLCGSAIGWVEAFHTYPENTPPNGFYFSGNCPSKITKAEWRWYQEDNKGAKIGSANVRYGDTIQLHIETEGLNGDHVEASFKEDETNSIITSTEGRTFNGYLILNVPIKNVWRSKLFNVFERMGNDVLNITPILSYKNHYTGIKGEFEAPAIKIQNKVREFAIAKGGAVPVTVGKVATNPLKYNPCKYSKITLKQKKRDDYIFFDEAAKLYGQEKPFQFIAGKKDIEDNRTTISIEGLKTNPDVFCLEKDGHKGHVFEYNETLKKWVKEEKDAELKLGITYNYPNDRPFPIAFIWLDVLKTQNYNFNVFTCRYQKEVKLNVYPDLKWKIEFFLNLSNDLSVKWQNSATEVEHRQNQKSAGKIGAERRWKQKDASFGFKLESEWNKLASGNYQDKEDLSLAYEGKFKKLYDIFSSLNDISDGITSKTKGTVRKAGLTGIPIDFKIKPPNLKIEGAWQYAIAKDDEKTTNMVGTQVDISVNAKPLIGLEITIDLLGALIIGVATVATGGAAAGATRGVMTLYNKIKDFMNTGVKIGDDKIGAEVKADVYIDLVITNTISTNVDFSFNTENKPSDSILKLEATNKLKVEAKAGAYVKGKVSIVIIKLDGYFEMKASGQASVTFGPTINYSSNGLYFRPILGFDGLTVEYVIKGEVRIALEKDGVKVEHKQGKTWAEGKETLVEKFDVIKALEERWGIDANIPLIKYDKIS